MSLRQVRTVISTLTSHTISSQRCEKEVLLQMGRYAPLDSVIAVRIATSAGTIGNRKIATHILRFHEESNR